ncbi:DUF2637 domain-containing protein [Dactylosporangium sp. NPDC005555]|uniref:DUF2637 domain-containing protein n=1 Tax=Dactylosporangium sp. NPDC005555 TaxID=3154889 RepID=UPI0033B264AF
MNARRFASIAGTIAVTTIAAIASYDHMRELAERAGQAPILAALLPLSVDGMVLVATLALGDGRRSKWSAWLAFLVGVAASLAANVIVAPPGIVARVVSAWPAVALLLTVEVLARSGRTAVPAAATTPVLPAVAEPHPAPTVAAVVSARPRPVPDAVPPGVRVLPIVRAVPIEAVSVAAPPKTADRVAAVLAEAPSATPAQIAARLGLSERTVRRYLGADRVPTRRRLATA